MNDVSNLESDEEAERKVRIIVLTHLYLKKRERQDKVSLQEIEDRVSSLDQACMKIDLVKLWNNSNLVEITEDGNVFSITDEGMAEEKKGYKRIG